MMLNRYGDEEEAIKIAEARLRQFLKNGTIKPSEMYPCTTVYELVKEIKEKVKRNFK